MENIRLLPVLHEKKSERKTEKGETRRVEPKTEKGEPRGEKGEIRSEIDAKRAVGPLRKREAALKSEQQQWPNCLQARAEKRLVIRLALCG